jgi:hypothetical protein
VSDSTSISQSSASSVVPCERWPLHALRFLVLAGVASDVLDLSGESPDSETHPLKTCSDRAERLRDLLEAGWRPGLPLPQGVAAKRGAIHQLRDFFLKPHEVKIGRLRLRLDGRPLSFARPS